MTDVRPEDNDPSQARATPCVSSTLDRLIQWPAATALPIYLVMVLLTWGTTPDDGFITLRIAHNLLHHGEPVFNLGDKVEGYSSPLHLLVAALVTILPADYTGLILKVIGVAFGAAVLWPTARLAANVGLGPRGRLASTVGVALSWNLAASASNLLESSMNVLLIVLLLAALTSFSYRHAAGWAGLLVLVRPESVLMVAAIAIGWTLLNRAEPVARRTRWIIAPTVVAVVLLAYRLIYFGELMPNTYYAKEVPIADAINWGNEYIVHAQPWWGTISVLGLLALYLQLGLGVTALVSWWRHSPILLVLPLVVAVQAAFIFRSGGDWMWGARHYAAVTPIVTVMAVYGAKIVAQAIASSTTGSPVAGRTAVGTAIVGVLLICIAGPGQETVNPAWNTRGVDNGSLVADGGYGPYSASWIESVRLTSCLPEGATVSFSEVGYFGYINRELTVIDVRGLTNSAIAKNAAPGIRIRTGVHDPNWQEQGSVVGAELLRRRPDVIVTIDTDNPPANLYSGTYDFVSTREVFGKGETDGALHLNVYRLHTAPDYLCLHG
jgi:arabinofuranosyltransferase